VVITVQYWYCWHYSCWILNAWVNRNATTSHKQYSNTNCSCKAIYTAADHCYNYVHIHTNIRSFQQPVSSITWGKSAAECCFWCRKQQMMKAAVLRDGTLKRLGRQSSSQILHRHWAFNRLDGCPSCHRANGLKTPSTSV